MPHDGLSDFLRFPTVRSSPASIVHAVRDEVEVYAQVVAILRARDDEQPVIVERPIRDRDQRFVARSVVPTKHLRMDTCGLCQRENALQVTSDEIVFRHFLVVNHRVKEARGRKLLLVPHDNHLVAPRYRSKRLHGLNLTGLVDD